MIKIKEAVLVEGKYDKIKLQGIIDAPIITTNGFRIFKDKEKQLLIRKMAKKRGVLIITDSDSAGFVIRNFIKGIIPEKNIKQCYIPQLKGKESRKPAPSKEGLLGVEGVGDEIIINAIRKSSATIIGEDNTAKPAEIKKSDLFDLGLSGTQSSKQNRERLMKYLGLPTYLSANAMLSALNVIMTKNELFEIVNDINKIPINNSPLLE
ncbi:MAG: DUF4093 domain-containing protein [Ruminococcus sp.]|nr:DUF4093 domain-containing protein [Ruminococcus sp.]